MPERIEKPLMLTGNRVVLRQITAEDVSDRYLGWLNDPEVNRFLEVRLQETTLDSLGKFVRDLQGDKENILFTIRLLENDLHIGNVKLGPINSHHLFAEVGIMIGDRSHWGKGYAGEALKLTCRYAFGQMGLHKITAGCYANNEASRALFLKCGFKIEGIRERQWLFEGQYVDSLLFGLLNPLDGKG